MTTNTNAAPDNCTVLPDGSAFATASCPLPKNHWLYAPREYEPGAEEPKELPPPILTHAHSAAVVAAVRYAIRSATMCGKEKDFDPDALVQNAVYALCGPYGKAALSTAAQPPADGALNTIAAMFHSAEEIEGPDGLAMMVDMSVWNDALDAFDEISGDEMEPAHPTAGIWVPTELADRVQETMVNDVKQYPPLPAPDTHCFDEDTGKDVWSYSADQMRAYVDADRAMRAASQDADDAARYRYLKSIAVQTADPLGPIFSITIRRIDQCGVWGNVSATIDAHIAARQEHKP